jgi:hypothetical protein
MDRRRRIAGGLHSATIRKQKAQAKQKAAAKQTAPAQLGKVHFATTCTPAAQKLFNRAMLYQHSFWYRASKQAFEEVIKSDPNCAIAY